MILDKKVVFSNSVKIVSYIVKFGIKSLSWFEFGTICLFSFSLIRKMMSHPYQIFVSDLQLKGCKDPKIKPKTMGKAIDRYILAEDNRTNARENVQI